VLWLINSPRTWQRLKREASRTKIMVRPPADQYQCPKGLVVHGMCHVDCGNRSGTALLLLLALVLTARLIASDDHHEPF
jgi:hypothetical protein